jgi:N-acetylglucosamine kinase-like BadF-type ATPase
MARVYVGLDAGSTTCHIIGMDKEGTIIVGVRRGE